MWLAVEDGPYVSATAPFDPRAVLDVARNRGVASVDTRVSRTHVGALRDVDLDFRVRRGLVLARYGVESRPARSSPSPPSQAGRSDASARAAGPIAFGKARVARLARSSPARPVRAAPASSSARRARALRLRRVWGFSVVADSAQFSALVVGVQPAHARRHGADAANVRGLSADDCEHPAAALGCRGRRLAMGVPDARSRDPALARCAMKRLWMRQAANRWFRTEDQA